MLSDTGAKNLVQAREIASRMLDEELSFRAERLKEWLGEGGGPPDVRVLRALLLHAVLDAPDLLETGGLDAAHLLLYQRMSAHIDAKLKEAGEEQPSIYDMALWELKLCALACIRILVEHDNRPKAMERARKKVCELAVAGGFELTVSNIKKFQNRDVKGFRAAEVLNPTLTVEGQERVLRAVAAQGVQIENVIAGAIKGRARVAALAKRSKRTASTFPLQDLA